MQLFIFCLIAVLINGDDSPKLTFSRAMFLQLALADFKAGNSPERTRDLFNEIQLKRTLIAEMSIEQFDSSEIQKEHDRLVKKLAVIIRERDPEYYRLLAFRSAVEELKSKSIASRNPADLFLFGNPETQVSLRLTETQIESFEKLAEKLSIALNKVKKEFESDLKEILKERYHAILAELDEVEREFIEANYGEPIVLSNAYVLSGPLQMRDFYHISETDPECLKTLQVLWDEFYKVEPVEPQYSPEHVSNMVVRLIYSDLLDFDKKQISDIAEALKTGNGAKYTEYNVQHRRQRQLDLVKEGFEYPQAFKDALSEKQLLRLKQVEYQFLRKTIVDFGMLPEEYRPSMILTRESTEIVTEQLKLQEEQINSAFRSQLEKTADLLREAYKTSEQLLSKEQREVALPESKLLDGDIVFLLTGVKSKQERE